MTYYKVIIDGYIISVGISTSGSGGISKEEYDMLSELLSNRPTAPDDKHEYKLRDDTLEWELTDRGGGL